MPDLFYLVPKWWKQILFIVVLSLIVAYALLYLRPVKYLATTTALPASSYASDKAKIFNENIQLLYPAIGTAEDLDLIVGTGQLDTVYIAVAEQFGLAGHHKTQEKGDAAKRKAALLLKSNTRIIKSDYGELKVKVWDSDKTIAPQLANAILQKLGTMHENMRNESNKAILKALENSRANIQLKIDSITIFLATPEIMAPVQQPYLQRRNALAGQLDQYGKLISEYQLMVDNKPPVLVIVEKAREPDWPDKPKKLPVLVATFVLSFLFALLVILVIEKRKEIKL
jgi:hypothetical protein